MGKKSVESNPPALGDEEKASIRENALVGELTSEQEERVVRLAQAAEKKEAKKKQKIAEAKKDLDKAFDGEPTLDMPVADLPVAELPVADLPVAELPVAEPIDGSVDKGENVSDDSWIEKANDMTKRFGRGAGRGAGWAWRGGAGVFRTGGIGAGGGFSILMNVIKEEAKMLWDKFGGGFFKDFLHGFNRGWKAVFRRKEK